MSSSWQNGIGSAGGVILCVFPDDSALRKVDDIYCFWFGVSDPVTPPASLHVVGTNTIVDSRPGEPSDQDPSYTFVPEDGNAPEVAEAYIAHDQLGATWDGNQSQHVEGTVQFDSADDVDCQGSLDVEVVGALPPKSPDVVIDAHLTGTFAVKLQGY